MDADYNHVLGGDLLCFMKEIKYEKIKNNNCYNVFKNSTLNGIVVRVCSDSIKRLYNGKLSTTSSGDEDFSRRFTHDR